MCPERGVQSLNKTRMAPIYSRPAFKLPPFSTVKDAGDHQLGLSHTVLRHIAVSPELDD